MPWQYSLGEIAQAAGGNAIQGDAVVAGVCTDTRKLQAGQLFVAQKGDSFDANSMLYEAFAKGAAAVLTTRGDAPGPAIVCEDPLGALQRFAAWHRARFDIPVLGITGSVGKTTTKDFTAAVLGTKYKVVKTPGNLNNAIGCPLSLLEIQDDTGFAVIEMGANHVGEIAELCELARPTESVITLIGETHVEGFGGIEGVATAKAEIVQGLTPGGLFYVNSDDPRCVYIATQYDGPKCSWGSLGDVRLSACNPAPDGGMIVEVAPVGRMHLPLAVPAQATSVVIAVAVGLQHGISGFEEALREACLNAVRFKVRTLGPLKVLDDTYNASPPSMRAALEALSLHQGGRKFAALGEMFELGSYAPDAHRALGEECAKWGVDAVFALGEHAGLLADAARAAGVAEAAAYESHAAIAAAVMERARPGDALLVKGSRGMKMETVIAELEAVIPAKAGI